MTAAQASLTRIPSSTNAATSASSESTSASGVAPANTTVISPRIPSAAQSANSPSVPRRISSWVLVNSRHTTARRCGPSWAAASARQSASRRGDSKNTAVRGSTASTASQLRRADCLRGANPSKQNRSDGNPDTASAVVTAEGPGRQETIRPASIQAETRR